MTAPPEWAPERRIDPALAGPVIADQFPELAGQPVRWFDSGWDNAVLGVGDDWLFRFIHRAVALDGARRELAVLTHLANRFDLAIPHPQLVGRPTPEVPWPFWGTRALPGRELAATGLPDDARPPVARALGAFLRQLHEPALARETTAAAAATGVVLPVDPIERGNPAAFTLRTRPRLDRLVASGTWARDPVVVDLLDRAARLPPPTGEPVLVHGDLHARHILVDDGTATGVIDWGDTALADPAVDLMPAYAAFVGPARTAFFDSYGDIPAERELRARALAVHVGAALLEYAAAEGMAEVRAEAAAALSRAVR